MEMAKACVAGSRTPRDQSPHFERIWQLGALAQLDGFYIEGL